MSPQRSATQTLELGDDVPCAALTAVADDLDAAGEADIAATVDADPPTPSVQIARQAKCRPQRPATQTLPSWATTSTVRRR